MTAGKGRPEWVFSCFGPGRNAPRQLFGGPQREHSFEELRLRHYEAAATGNAEQAVQEAQMLYAESVNQMEAALRDISGAIKYILDGANEHPNRIDIAEGKTGPGPGPSFSQPSAFGTPSFDQPSGVGQSAFGKPSAFGQPSTFGQPSAPAQPSGFGQPSALGTGSAFGQPSGVGGGSTFGKPAFGQPSLGQPSAGPPSSFGQPAFGQPSFGQPSAPGAGPFGKPTTVSPFAQISGQNQQPGGGFCQPSGQTASPFAQIGQQPQPQPAPAGFGQPSTTGFGQPSQTASPFGQPAAPFGQPTQTPFGAAAQQPQQQPTPSPFGQPAAGGFGQPTGAPTGFGQPVQTPAQAPTQAPVQAPVQAPAQAPIPSQPAGTGPPPVIRVDDSKELNPIPPLNGQTIRNSLTNKLTTWKGQPVDYINDAPCYLHPQDRQTWVRIFFPDGPPEQASLRDAQGKPEEYTPEIMEQYEFFMQNGYFRDGVIPSVPPKTEWVSFDF